jgi:hypothetical protein
VEVGVSGFTMRFRLAYRRKLYRLLRTSFLVAWLLLVFIWLGSAFAEATWARENLSLSWGWGDLLVCRSSVPYCREGWSLGSIQSPRLSFGLATSSPLASEPHVIWDRQRQRCLLGAWFAGAVKMR